MRPTDSDPVPQPCKSSQSMTQKLPCAPLARWRASLAMHCPSMSWGLLVALLVAGCAARPMSVPEPLRAPKPVPATTAEVLEESGAGPARPARPLVESGPTADVPRVAPQAQAGPSVPPIPATKPVSLVLDGVPLATFINLVFGSELGFAIEIEQPVRERQELVTLRVAEPQRPRVLYLTAVEVLRNYGVDVSEHNGLLRFSPAAAGSEPPLLVTARSLPDIPAGQRTVFAVVPLDASTPGRVAGQVRSMFPNNMVTLSEMVETNGILIRGTGDNVRAAAEAVRALDRTSLRDKRSVRINPMYLAAELLATEVSRMLTAQGYPVTAGPGQGGVISLVPVGSANALMVFSESEAALAAAVEWARQLDQPGESGGGGGVYMYAARHTTVESLRPVLEAMVGAAPSASRGASSSPAPSNGGAGDMQPPQAGPARARGPGGGGGAITGNDGQIAVDPVRNVIVFQGDAQRWRAIQGVLARLDQPARQVVIEVTVAEVTLTDEFSHGVEWALRNITIDGVRGPLTALGGAARNAGGIVWNGLSSSGQVRAILNLFARDSRVSILSTPRLMVKSGETASIDVGTEVPIITSQATAPDLPNNNASILQSIQYRKTGVLLEIEALVHSGQRVDLNIAQEVSEATQTDTSDISSPSIFSRRLETSLSLSDGESMLLGGLISSTNSDGKTKVPLLGDVPGLGRLFQNRRRDGARTELLMLITPYVIEDAIQAREITDAVKVRFPGADHAP